MKINNRADTIESALITIKAASKILNISPPKVYFATSRDFPNSDISSIYRHKENIIIFNEDWIDRSHEIEVIITAFHETRHSYQHHCIETKSNESIETITIWEKEFKHYTSPSGRNTPKSDIDYLNQAIEIDAIAFVYHQMKAFYDIDVKIPDVIKDKVMDYVRLTYDT
jgi:hypothetical protein